MIRSQWFFSNSLFDGHMGPAAATILQYTVVQNAAQTVVQVVWWLESVLQL